MAKLGTIDLDTGEIVEGVAVWIGRRRRLAYARWAAMNQDFMEEFAARTDVGLQAWRVFGYLIARLDFDNLIQVKTIEIGEKLNMKRQNVRRALKKLEDLGVLIPGPSSSWRLNANAGWKGKIRQLDSALTRQLSLVE